MASARPQALSTRRTDALRSLLVWEGELARARVMELFHVSATRASEWIRELRELHPTWTRWASRVRVFVATPSAYNALRDADRTQSLTHYLSLAGLTVAGQAEAGVVRAFNDFIAPPPEVFAAIRRAIAGRRQLRITYRSMREPEAHPHLIEPHSLVLAGPRWHVRAFSVTRGDFRDFALGRVSDCKLLDEAATHTATIDSAWEARVDVTLVAHPALSQPRQDVVRQEYFAGAVQRVEPTRGALVPYLLHELRVSLDHKRQAPPDYLLAVREPDQIKRWLFGE